MTVNEPSNTSRDASEISSGQIWLIDRMHAAGYEVTKEGMCHGITFMAIQAFLMGEMDKFLKRLHAIAAIPTDDFKAIMEKRRTDEGNAFKSGHHEDPNQIYAKDVYAFFDGVALYQNPHFHREIFPTGVQKDNVAKELVNPVRRNVITSCLTSTIIYTSEEDIKTYLNCLQTHFNSIPVSIYFLTGEHAVSIHFNPENKTWLFFDPNRMDDKFENNLELLAKKIASSAAYQGCLYTSIMTNQTNATVTEEIMENLQQDHVWNSLYQFTEEKNRALIESFPAFNLHYGSYLGFICAAGDLVKVREFFDNPEYAGTQISFVDRQRKSFLIWAIRSGKQDLLKYLFEHTFSEDQNLIEKLLDSAPDSSNAYISALLHGDTTLFDFILSYDVKLSRKYFYNDIQSALAHAIEKKDEKSIQHIGAAILNKELFNPSSFLTVLSQLMIKDPLERFLIISNQVEIVKTGIELALIMHLLTMDECQSFLSMRNNIHPEIILTRNEFTRILHILNPDKGLIFFETFKDKFPEIFSTSSDFLVFLRSIPTAFNNRILKACHDRCISIFKTEQDLDNGLNNFSYNKNPNEDFIALFNLFDKNKLCQIVTYEFLKNFMSRDNISHDIKKSFLVKLEMENLLQPIIRSIWKENRADHANFFSCSASEGEKAYRDTQQVSPALSHEDKVLAKLASIGKYVNQQNDPFAIKLEKVFPKGFLDALSQTEQDKSIKINP